MKNLILYVALVGGGNYQSLEPCDSSCYDEPQRLPDKSLENILSMAIRKENFNVPEGPNYKLDFNCNDGRESLGKLNRGYNLGNNFRKNISTNSGKRGRVSQIFSKFSGAHNSKPLNLCDRK
jgi:hypothetical protein